MPKTRFPFHLFFALLFLGSGATFLTANNVSVSTHSSPADMVKPFPVILEISPTHLQVVTPEQLEKLQLPDPITSLKMQPQYLLSDAYFIDGIMASRSILGESITNGNAIQIPTDYVAQVSGRTIDRATQEFTIVFSQGAKEDQLITVIYTATTKQYSPQKQYVKNVLIWKTIFMNGMMASLILAFVIGKLVAKRNERKENQPS